MLTMVYADITLKAGSHNLLSGVNILEAEVVLAGYQRKPIRNSDDLPPCFSRVICDYVTGINDAMPHAERQKLKVFLGRLNGTRGTRKVEHARAECLVMVTAKPAAVSALHSVGLHKYADAVEAATTLVELEVAGWSAAKAAKAAKNGSSAVWPAAIAAEWANRATDSAEVAAAAAAEWVVRWGGVGSYQYDWQPHIDALEAALKIGPQAPPIKPIVARERLRALREATGCDGKRRP
ncbi:MAG: hypothetical protein OEZ19_03970 [Paracoccaceae bacterium]|nr:hypothetical protein [Paracoccaceae bacterium]